MTAALNQPGSLKGLRLAVIEEYMAEGLDAEVRAQLRVWIPEYGTSTASLTIHKQV